MNILSVIKISFRSILSNKVRTGLTILGIVIGIASVIIVFSAGDGIESLVVGQIESYGTDIVVAEVRIPTGKKGQTSKDMQSGAAMAQGVQITTLKLDDMEDINKLPNVVNSYGGIMGQEQVSHGNEIRKAFLFGTNASYIDIDKSEIEYGSFFSEEEDRALSEVAVLGSKMKEKLFGDSDPIGNIIKIRKEKFRVIGIMKERGAVMGMDYDDFVYIPVRTLQKKIMGINHLSYTVHQLKDLSLAEETAEDIRHILRENHDIVQPITELNGNSDLSKDDFRVTTMVEMMDMLGTVTNALTLLLLAVVAISLVVGGVGIMNIMYVSVSERTAEIGLRKALGAKYFDIMLQFLSESIIITFVGGIIGILGGIFISFLISLGANKMGFDWEFNISLNSLMVATFFSLVFGVGFGLYPARKAAKLSPIEALRKE